MEQNKELPSTNYPAYWCKRCSIPVLANNCPLCNEKTKEISNDRRPVSPIERRMLETLVLRPLPTFLFARHNMIYFGDKALLRLSIDKGELKLAQEWFFRLDSYGIEIFSENYRISQWDKLLSANKEALLDMEQESIGFIKSVAERYFGRQRFISFSGGKDSALTAVLVNKALGQTPLLFSDTTIEYPLTYEYIIQFAEFLGVELYWQKPQQTFMELCDLLDPPSRIMRWCCTVCKSQPINKFYNTLEKMVLNFDGIRRAESSRRAKYPRVYQVPKYAREITARPILEWPTFAVWAYIESYGIPNNPLYDLGFSRIGCMYCPSNKGYNEFLMKLHFPDFYSKWYEYLLSYAIREGKSNPENYVKSGYWKTRNIRREKHYEVQLFETCVNKQEYSYEFSKPITEDILNFLRPLGKTSVFNIDGNNFFTVGGSNPFLLSGTVGDTNLVITFANRGKEEHTIKSRLERQIEKYLNCIKCGGCIGVCPVGAISISDQKFIVDSNKCFGCGKCTMSLYLDRACIALGYRGSKRAIRRDVL